MKVRVDAVKRKGSKTPEFFPKDRLLMIAGNYGSGKTEIAVNLALDLARRGRRVQIADLDIVNPYFRCREARALMEASGIRVVVPPASQTWADLPIVVPEIKGMLEPAQDQVSLFDVGGDDVGAKLLSSFVEPLGDNPYALWQVINARRPFTDTVEGCLAMRDAIEHAARLQITGLLVNTHLMDETTPEIVREGYEMAAEAGKRAGLPVVGVCVMKELADHPALQSIRAPLLRLTRTMLPPWKRPSSSEPDEIPSRPVPIGRP